ncbi:MAG TPA: TGS domain-containing protein [bacterium]|nr:TGS domain-containing protein [bacterium]
MSEDLRIGTRASLLALWQANWVKSRLEEFHPGIGVTLVHIKTEGDRIELPEAATVLDFAYQLGAEIGNRFKRAEANNEKVGMDFQPKLFDQLKIFTDKAVSPDIRWIEHAHTPEAKMHIKRSLSTQSPEKAEATGKRTLLSVAAENNLCRGGASAELDGLLLPVTEFLGMKGVSEFYSQVGFGEIDIPSALGFLREQYRLSQMIDVRELEPAALGQKIYQTEIPARVVDSERTLKVPLYPCEYCSPLPGDEVTIYATGRRAVLHRKDCSKAGRILLRARKQIAVWGVTKGVQFPARIIVKLIRAKKAYREVLRVFEKAEAPIVFTHTNFSRENGLETIEFIIEARGASHVANICDELLSHKDVVFAKRI